MPVVHRGDMAALMDGIPLGEMNTSMTINATAAWLLGAIHRGGRGTGRGAAQPPGHDPERHHQGVPGARHLRVSASALDALDRGHDRLHRRARAEVEPDQHLLLSPAGGRRHTRAGDRLRDEQRDRRARCRAREIEHPARPTRRRADGRRVRAHLLLRQRRRALRRGARQAARDGDPLGRARARALRRRRTSVACAFATAYRSTRSA